MPGQWCEHVQRWLEATEPLRRGGAPDDLERYFLFQTLVGAWPIEPERIEAYMKKALREAKRDTDWVDQNPDWEGAVADFCRGLYSNRAFLDDFEPFVAEVAPIGDRIALGMVALKLTAPGVPDIYQGDELPYQALVDPDNRRPVDWRLRQSLLARLLGGARPTAQTFKLWLISRLLGLRIRRPSAFAGGYQPVSAGERAVAYLRGGEVLVVVATRPDASAGRLAAIGGRWRSVLGGEDRSLRAERPLGEVLDEHGIGVYERI